MAEHRGEKIGWIGGWIGGFTWVGLFSFYWLVSGRPLRGALMGLLFAAGLCATFFFAPWRHPKTRYWVLLAPLYGLQLIAAICFIWLVGSVSREGMDWHLLLIAALIMLPLITMGNRTWEDGNTGKDGNT